MTAALLEAPSLRWPKLHRDARPDARRKLRPGAHRELPDAPADRDSDLRAELNRRSRATDVHGLLVGRPASIEVDQSLAREPLDRLIGHLAQEWDVRRRGSDLDRINHYPGVVVAVSPVTLRLVDNVRSSRVLARRAGVDTGRCDILLDHRHSRVGLDPTAAALASRLVPATAVDLLVELCVGTGARTGRVSVGDTARDLQDPAPAWLRQAAVDVAATRGRLVQVAAG